MTDYAPFTDSTALLGDDTALRNRFTEQGYLYLRGVVDTAEARELRRDIAAQCAAEGWLKPDTPPEDFVAWTVPSVEGEEAYFKAYDRVQRLQSFHALPHSAGMSGVMRSLLGPSAFPHPLSIARLVFPFNQDFATPPHQDYPNNQGTADLYACWTPLMDCPVALGPLAIAVGSHRQGILPLEYALGAGHRQVAPRLTDNLHWVSGPMAVGDVLVFHSLTVHRALPNQTEQMRISVDYRFQAEGEALVEQSLNSHFQRQSWDEIYADWDRDELKYYWKSRDYTVVPWDPDIHQVPQTLQEAVALNQRYKQQRAKLADKFRS